MKSCFLFTARVDLKGPTGTFFSIFWEKSVFFQKNSVHSSQQQNYILKKKDFRQTDWLFFCPPGGQETIIHIRMA